MTNDGKLVLWRANINKNALRAEVVDINEVMVHTLHDAEVVASGEASDVWHLQAILSTTFLKRK